MVSRFKRSSMRSEDLAKTKFNCKPTSKFRPRRNCNVDRNKQAFGFEGDKENAFCALIFGQKRVTWPGWATYKLQFVEGSTGILSFVMAATLDNTWGAIYLGVVFSAMYVPACISPAWHVTPWPFWAVRRFFGITNVQSYNYYIRYPRDWMVYRISVSHNLLNLPRLAHHVAGWSSLVRGALYFMAPRMLIYSSQDIRQPSSRLDITSRLLLSGHYLWGPAFIQLRYMVRKCLLVQHKSHLIAFVGVKKLKSQSM